MPQTVAPEPGRLLIDGHEVAKATADRRGRIEIEVSVPLPGAASK